MKAYIDRHFGKFAYVVPFAWLLVILFFFVVLPKAYGQDFAFKLDHIDRGHSVCAVDHNDDYSAFQVKETVRYTDGTPYAGKWILQTKDARLAFIECRNFLTRIALAEVNEQMKAFEERIVADALKAREIQALKQPKQEAKK